MSAWESWILEYLLNSLWQIPVVFAAAWLVARLVKGMSPRIGHRVWVVALVLEVLMPAFRLRPAELFSVVARLLPWRWVANTAGSQVQVTVGPGAPNGGGLLRLSAQVFTGVVAVYVCSLFYFAARLGWGLWKTKMVQRRAAGVMLSDEAEQSWRRFRHAFRVESARLAVSPEVSGPVTVGVPSGLLLVPAAFLSNVGANDLDAMFAHECAHIQRHDFAKNMLYELLSLPVAYHPLLHLTAVRIAETREMVCDAMAAEAVAGRENYARSLLRLASMIASRKPVKTLHAIGIFDANIFERRVMNLTRRHAEIGSIRQFAVATLCAAIALATCGTALALRMEVTPRTSTAAAQEENTVKPKVAAGIMAGQKISGMNPVYPPQAKLDKIEGPVVLAVTINEKGEPVDVHVKKGVRDDLDESALTAVQTWRWKPYLLNGNPTAVQTTVTVTYSLQH